MMNTSRRLASKLPVRLLLIFVGFAAPFYVSVLFFSRILSPPTQNYYVQQPIVNQKPSSLPSATLESSIVATDFNDKPVDFALPLKEELNLETAPMYNMRSPPSLQQNDELQNIVERITQTIASKGLPTEHLSISLIDLSTTNYNQYGAFQDKAPRFPASVSKLFWLVAYLSYSEHGLLSKDSLPEDSLYKLAHKSDNESASRILDLITDTESGDILREEDFGIWDNKRKSVNHFFEEAGYQSLNVSQKNFPVPYLGLQEPTGRDLQMRGKGTAPLRNFMTTYDAVRLMYEIATEKAVSAEASLSIQSLLTHDLNPSSWKQEPYNSIEGFLGEGLPSDTKFVTKVGWTSSSRQEVAFVTSADGQTRYILSIMGDDSTYSDDWKVFPEVSRIIFDEMVLR
jgi:hypothetical protein